MKRKRNVKIALYALVGILVFLLAPARADVTPGETIDKTNWQKAEGLLPDPVLNYVKKGDFILHIGKLNYDRGGGRSFKRRQRPTPASTTSTRRATSSIPRSGSGRNTSMASPFRRSIPRTRKPLSRSPGTGRSRFSGTGRTTLSTPSNGLVAAVSSAASPVYPRTTTSTVDPTR